MHFSFWDYLVVFIYITGIVAIGFFSNKKNKNMLDYLLAGRRLTLPLFVGTMVSTWYGGILGVGEISYSSGIYNWLTQGFFWYIAYFIFAFFLAERLRRSENITLPDQLEQFYGKGARKIGLVLNFMNMVPISYLISLGIIIKLVFPVSLPAAIVIGGFITCLYTVVGGFWADIYTDFLQFNFMCIGVALIIPFCYFKFGGWDFLTANLPASHFSLTGGFPVAEILVWGFIALNTLIDPTFYQRCFSAQTPKVAKNGILISIILWVLFDICTTFTGLYARAAFPGIDPKSAFPVLADNVLPPFFKGFYFVGLIATVMSTVDSFSFVGGTTFGRDLCQKVLFPNLKEKTVILLTRIGIIITVTIAVVFAFGLYDSIKVVWKLFGSITASGLLIPMIIGLFLPKLINRKAGIASMCIGLLSAGTFYIGDKFFVLKFFGAIEPLYPGLLGAILAYFCVYIFSRKHKTLEYN